MTLSEASLQTRYQVIRQRIAAACARVGRDPEGVTLVAVTKQQPIEKINACYQLGLRVFGENYVQELLEKQQALRQLTDIRWHMIGHLQTNKVKQVVPKVAVIESVDSARLVQALSKRAVVEGVTPEIMLQVNLGSESQKSGCSFDELESLIGLVKSTLALRLRGLMGVPPARPAELNRTLFRRLSQAAQQFGLDEVSMGMSDDFEVAIEEGSTCVRIGTALLGKR